MNLNRLSQCIGEKMSRLSKRIDLINFYILSYVYTVKNLKLNILKFFLSFYRALEVWGSKEALLKELLKKEVERKIYHQSMYILTFL